MEAVRGDAEEHVADGSMVAPVMMSGRLTAADDGAGEIVLSVPVKTGHLGGFAADEGAAVGAAGLAEMPWTTVSTTLFSSAAGGQVVEEEERGRALDGDVIDAVVDEVRAHGVVDAEFEGHLEFGAHTVRA